MTIREKVARAICQEGGCEDSNCDCPFTGLEKEEGRQAATAITAFLEAAAEQGWHMRPDEATEEMRIANCELDCGYAVCHKAAGGPRCVNHGGRRKYSDESWAAMLAAAPEFSWNGK